MQASDTDILLIEEVVARLHPELDLRAREELARRALELIIAQGEIRVMSAARSDP